MNPAARYALGKLAGAIGCIAVLVSLIGFAGNDTLLTVASLVLVFSLLIAVGWWWLRSAFLEE